MCQQLASYGIKYSPRHWTFTPSEIDDLIVKVESETWQGRDAWQQLLLRMPRTQAWSKILEKAGLLKPASLVVKKSAGGLRAICYRCKRMRRHKK